jgi:hypothetical protein
MKGLRVARRGAWGLREGGSCGTWGRTWGGAAAGASGWARRAATTPTSPFLKTKCSAKPSKTPRRLSPAWSAAARASSALTTAPPRNPGIPPGCHQRGPRLRHRRVRHEPDRRRHEQLQRARYPTFEGVKSMRLLSCRSPLALPKLFQSRFDGGFERTPGRPQSSATRERCRFCRIRAAGGFLWRAIGVSEWRGRVPRPRRRVSLPPR